MHELLVKSVENFAGWKIRFSYSLKPFFFELRREFFDPHVISITISTADNQKLSTKSGVLNFIKIMSYHFSNFEPSASYSRNSRMDFFDATFRENVSNDFLTLLSQENTFPNENAAPGSHPSYLSTEKRIFF